MVSFLLYEQMIDRALPLHHSSATPTQQRKHFSYLSYTAFLHSPTSWIIDFCSFLRLHSLLATKHTSLFLRCSLLIYPYVQIRLRSTCDFGRLSDCRVDMRMKNPYLRSRAMARSPLILPCSRSRWLRSTRTRFPQRSHHSHLSVGILTTTVMFKMALRPFQ